VLANKFSFDSMPASDVRAQSAPRPICVVVDPWDLPYNGTVVSSRRFVDALRQRGHGFRILSCPIEEGKVVDADTDDDDLGQLERHYFPALSILGVNGIIRAMKVMLARPNSNLMERALTGARLVHVQFPFFLGYSAIKMARRLNVPVVCSFHVQPENLLLNLGLNFKWLRELLYKIFIRYIYNQADLVIAPSEFAANELLKRNLAKPIEVVSNGVPDEFFLPASMHQTESKGSTFCILSVGRFSSEKQQCLLIDAISHSDFRDKIELRLVGAGPNESKLKAHIQRAGINAVVETVTNAELLLRYERADLFVHCGIIELEGMSIIEAMATGKVVLVSDSEASAAGIFALSEFAKFKSGDLEDLRCKLDYWVQHPQISAEQSATNRNFIASYKHNICVEKLERLYSAICLRTGHEDEG
jgi:1,2-diacylglycerol 3-alpha-glucosyltransferase